MSERKFSGKIVVYDKDFSDIIALVLRDAADRR